MNLDEKRIQEIVEKVMARLGTGVPSTPMEAVQRAPNRPSLSNSDGPRPSARIPQGRLGVFPDVDSAAKASRKAFEELDKIPLETRTKMVAAMRKVTLDKVADLAQ